MTADPGRLFVMDGGAFLQVVGPDFDSRKRDVDSAWPDREAVAADRKRAATFSTNGCPASSSRRASVETGRQFLPIGRSGVTAGQR
jgi:hypothetical protein